jgi:hypothetical protein
VEERERSRVGKPRAVRRLRERTGRQILSRHVDEKERPRAGEPGVVKRLGERKGVRMTRVVCMRIYW